MPDAISQSRRQGDTAGQRVAVPPLHHQERQHYGDCALVEVVHRVGGGE
jgi:hypothetical protein